MEWEILGRFCSLYRGIRQGNPLSLYLFVMCTKRAFQLINLVVSHETWNPISLSKHDSPTSYLAFADGLILFAEALLEQVMLIKNIMKCRSTSN